MTLLTETEIETLLDYTGMNEAMEYELIGTPIIFFSRTGNVLNYVTLVTDLMKEN